MNPFDFTFNADDYKETLLPVGTYAVSIYNLERKTSVSGSNYLKVTYKVTQGEYKGEIVTDNLNLWNNDEQVVKISGRKLSKICKAVGLETISNLMILKGRVLFIKVGVKSQEGYEDKNVVLSIVTNRDKEEGEDTSSAEGPDIPF